MVALVLVATACPSKAPTGAPTVGPSPSASVSPTPTTTKKPGAPVARYAITVIERRLSLYDVAKDRVTEVAQGEGVRVPRFVSANEVSFLQSGGGAATLRVINLKTKVVRDLFTEASGIETYAWSPDRGTIAYITTDAHAYPRLVFRHLSPEGDTSQPVATLARAPGRGRVASDQSMISFSPDGEDVLVVHTPADGDPQSDFSPEQSQLQVRSASGDLAFAADMAKDPTMATWSADGARMYLRTVDGARVWLSETGRSDSLRGGARWFNPTVSPDGKLLAYDTGSDRSGVRVRVLDLKSRSTKVVAGAGRFKPVFASGRALWVQRVKACSVCPGLTEPVNEVFAIDLRTGKSKLLAIKSLIDVDVLYR